MHVITTKRYRYQWHHQHIHQTQNHQHHHHHQIHCPAWFARHTAPIGLSSAIDGMHGRCCAHLNSVWNSRFPSGYQLAQSFNQWVMPQPSQRWWWGGPCTHAYCTRASSIRTLTAECSTNSAPAKALGAIQSRVEAQNDKTFAPKCVFDWSNSEGGESAQKSVKSWAVHWCQWLNTPVTASPKVGCNWQKVGCNFYTQNDLKKNLVLDTPIYILNRSTSYFPITYRLVINPYSCQ